MFTYYGFVYLIFIAVEISSDEDEEEQVYVGKGKGKAVERGRKGNAGEDKGMRQDRVEDEGGKKDEGKQQGKVVTGVPGYVKHVERKLIEFSDESCCHPAVLYEVASGMSASSSTHSISKNVLTFDQSTSLYSEQPIAGPSSYNQSLDEELLECKSILPA